MRRHMLREWMQCPVCQSAVSEPWVSFDQLAWARCSGCGVVYKQREPEVVRPTDFYETQYFHGRKSKRDKRFEHRVRKSKQQLLTVAEHAPPGARALDIGCSFGYVIEAANRLGMKGAGSDISQYAVKVCQERGYRAEVGTLEKQPFADGEFDVVTMKHVLEHTPAPHVALAEVTRLLARGGLVLVVCPALRYWKAFVRRRTGRYFRPDDLGMQHYIYHTADTLAEQLTRAGYEVLHRTNAVFRRKVAARGALSWLSEAVRYSWLSAKQWLAPRVFWQREVFVLARLK